MDVAVGMPELRPFVEGPKATVGGPACQGN